MPSSSLPPPVPEASDAAVEADQPTTFKRKKRPQGRSLSFKIPSGIDPQSTTDRDVVDGDAEADAAAELEADGTSSTLDSLLALRRLKRSTAGLDLERLNAGERKKRAKREEAGDGEGGAGGDGTVINKDGMLEGTNGGIQQGAGKDRLRDDGDAPEAKARKIVKSDNFTGQTNTVDVDKHMLAYIDAELARKRAPDPASAPTKSSKPHDPRDDLYRVSDKYKFDDIVETEKSKKDKDEEEGNVTLSASMLMGIPEVDLGIDIKLRNIEATEKAKRKLQEDKAAAARRRAEDPEADEFAVDRFYRHRRPLESDGSALERAKQEAARAADPANQDPDHHLRGKGGNRGGGGRGGYGGGGGGRGEGKSMDEITMQRFKKRQMQQFK